MKKDTRCDGAMTVEAISPSKDRGQSTEQDVGFAYGINDRNHEGGARPFYSGRAWGDGQQVAGKHSQGM